MKEDHTEDKRDASDMLDRQLEQWERYRKYKEVTSGEIRKRTSGKKASIEAGR